MPEVILGRAGELRVQLEDYEADVFRNLTSEMLGLLESDLPPKDPVAARLFPEAFDDAENERSYRDLIGDELLSLKRRNVGMVRQKLGPHGEAELEFTGEETDSWLSLLTDMRLAIGTRLGVTEEIMQMEPNPKDPEVTAMSVLHWLGWLQEATLEKLKGDM